MVLYILLYLNMFKNNLKIPKWQSESVNRRVTHNKIGQKDKQ